MKKSLLSFIVFFFVVCINAQTYTIQSFNKMTRYYDERKERWVEWSKPAPIDVKIVFNIDNRIVTFDNVYKDEFQLLSLINESKGADINDGDPWTSLAYNSTDKDGRKATISLQSFNSGVQLVIINYNNIRYVYKGILISQ
jgi:hypothetical protein